jgi:hypothetical protein
VRVRVRAARISVSPKRAGAPIYSYLRRGSQGGEEGLLARPLGFNESILGTFLNLTTTVDPAHWEDSFECAKIVDIFSIPCFTPQSIAFSFTALILGKSYIGINFVKKGTHE